MGQSVSSRPEVSDSLRIWEVDRLWELAKDLPVKRMLLTDLDDLDRVGWHGQPANYGRLTIREITEHIQRINQADLSFPLLLSAEGHLLDGFHRLAKAYLLGLTEIDVVQFIENPEPDRIHPLPDWLAQTLPVRTTEPNR